VASAEVLLNKKAVATSTTVNPTNANKVAGDDDFVVFLL